MTFGDELPDDRAWVARCVAYMVKLDPMLVPETGAADCRGHERAAALARSATGSFGPGIVRPGQASRGLSAAAFEACRRLPTLKRSIGRMTLLVQRPTIPGRRPIGSRPRNVDVEIQRSS